MRTISASAVLGLALGVFLAGPASADPYGSGREGSGYGDDDQGQGWTRRGSYRATCTNVQIDGDELEASCRERDGDWQHSNLQNFRSCRGDIYNDDGRLRCRRDDDDNDGGDRGYGDEGRGYGYPGYGQEGRDAMEASHSTEMRISGDLDAPSIAMSLIFNTMASRTSLRAHMYRAGFGSCARARTTAAGASPFGATSIISSISE